MNSSSKDVTPDERARDASAQTGVAASGMDIFPPPQSRKNRARFAVRAAAQFFIMVVVLIGASFLMQQLMGAREERPARAQKETVFTIETAQAEARDNVPMISVFGTVEAARTLNLTPLVSGVVVDVNPVVRVGGRVNKGDTLLRIEDFDFEIALSEARANFDEAEAMLAEANVRLELEKMARVRAQEQLELARSDLSRAQTLLRQRTITQRQVEERELTLSQRQAAFDSATATIRIQEAQIVARQATVARWAAQVQNAERSLEETVLNAPFDALVQAVNVEIGQTVTTAQTLMTLFEAQTLDVRFVLSDSEFGRLLSQNTAVEGRPIEVIWKVGDVARSFPATIDRVAAEIAADRGGVAVFGRLNPVAATGQLRPGAFVTVSVPDQVFEKSFRLPETAVFNGNEVFVVGQDNRLQERDVEVLVYDRGEAIIRSDSLRDGEQVLTTQLAEVGEGLLVRVEGEPPETPEKTEPEDIAPEDSAPDDANLTKRPSSAGADDTGEDGSRS